MTRNLVLALALAGALCLLPRPALAAATFTVNSTLDTVDSAPGDGTCADALGRCTLRAAIMETNALSGADTILLPAGTYTLTIAGRDENAAATGDLDITDALTITGTSGDPSTVIVDGATIDKVFSIDPLWNKSFATTIQNITITNGKNTSAASGDGYGGALDFDGNLTGTLTISNCIITNSQTANGPGGGLAVTASALSGGSANGSVTITHTRIAGNSAPNDSGGGIWVGSGVVVSISDSIIENNTTGNAGGGVAFTVDPPSGAHSITTSTIAGNSVTGSFQGGGIYATAALSVANSTIYGNATAANVGSGIYSSQYAGKPLTLTNVTITGNTAAGTGGALVHQNTSGGSTALVNNSIIAGNTNGDVSGTLMATSAYNLIGTGGSGGLTGGTNGNQVGVASPGLGSLTTINSWQKVIPLLPGSPALDAGSNSLVAGSTDQRGGPRILDAADADTTQTVDIGAYEASPMIALIANQSMNAGTDKTVTFNIGDGSQAITGTAASSNTAAVPNGALSISGSGSTRTLTVVGGSVSSGTATITVTLSYNGASVSTTFTLTVVATPDLTIAKSHSGNFRQGQTGSYTLTVTNAGSGATSGTVTVTDTLPAGLTASALSGTGWTCTLATLTCTRSDALAVGASYPPLTVSVNVAAGAGASLTNTASVSGGGEANTTNDTASDPTTVLQNTTTTLTVANGTYGGTVSFTATVTGGVAGSVQFAIDNGVGTVGTVAVSGGSATLPYTANIAPGAYTVTSTFTPTDPTYLASSQSQPFTVSKAPLTVTADSVSRGYGSANPAFTATYSGLMAGDTAAVLGGTLTFATAATQSSVPGTYPVTPGGLTSPNYTITFADGTLTVTKGTLTVTADNQSRPYGSANPTLTAAMSGFVLGEDASVLTGTLSVTTTAVATSGAGTYPITPSGLAAANYDITFVPGTLTVSKVALTVTATDASRLFGDANPAFGAAYSGFVLSDDQSVLGGTLAFATPATPDSNTGSYTITPSGLTSPNYSFIYIDGHLTITPAPLTITANDKSRVYGDANPAFDASYSGFKRGQDSGALSGVLAFTTPAANGSAPGTYTITPAGLSSGNYDITYVPGRLTVSRRPLTVTADNLSKTYGAANPTLTVSYSGFAPGEDATVLGGTLSVTTTATATSGVGTYPITPAGLTSANYSISFAGGTLTVVQAPLTVTADSRSRTYGSANPAFTATYSGLVAGDTAASLGGALTFTTAATQSSVPGTYVISVAGLTSPDYTITFVDGDLTVAKAPLTIKADDKTKLAGAPNPPLTVTYTGFVLGEDATVLAGTLSVTTTATDASSPGSYPILVSGVSAANYAITFVPGTLRVTSPAPPPVVRSLTVVVNSVSRPFGQPNPPLTGTVTGLLPEDGISISYATTATATSLPGDYPITPTFSDPNGKLALYTQQITPGTLTVLPAQVTVTVDDAARVYGEQNPKFSAQVAGLPDGVKLQLDFATTATRESPVGSYAIQAVATAGGAGLQVAVVPGTLTVTKAPLTVTPRDVDRLYGAENPPLTGKLEGVRSQDQIAASYSTPATRTSPPGAYPIVATLSDPNGKLGNYDVTLRQGTLTVRDCRDITVTRGAGGEPDAHMRCPLGPDTGRQAVQDLVLDPAGTATIVGASAAQVEDAIARAQIESNKAPRLLLETSSSDAAVQGAVIDQPALAALAGASGEVGVQTGYGSVLVPPAVVASLSRQEGQLVVLFEKVAVSGTGRFEPASPVVEVTVATRLADGTLDRHEQFAARLTLTLPLTAAGADPELAGIYRLTTDQDGNITGVEYVGGAFDAQTGTLAVPRERLSKYGVLIYDREYADVASDFWAYRAIKVMTARHVVQGVSDTQFDPQRAVTRAEFATMVARAFGVPIDPTSALTFADVAGDKWYAPVMSAVVQAGLYAPEAGNTLRPDVPITRQEMAMVIARALERFYPAAKLPDPVADQVLSPFADRGELTAAARNDVARLVAAGLIQGRAPDSLAPDGVTTRAEAVTLIKRLLDWGGAQ